jgi:lysophospholipase L1-like esterase
LTLSVIRERLAHIVRRRASDDAHLDYLDGHDLSGPHDSAEHPLPDNLHPDAATHQMIGERFARRAFPAP